MSGNTDVQKRVKLDPNRRVELPDEIWMKIMSYVKSMHLFLNVSLVCKRFYNIHRSAIKYLKVECVRNKKKFQSAIKVLAQCKSLKAFEIQYAHYENHNWQSKTFYMESMIKQVLISSQNLKILKLDQSATLLNMERIGIGILGKRLEHLEVNGRNIEGKSCISTLNELKTLRFDCFSERNDILSLIINFPKLEAIFFSNITDKKMDSAAFDEFFAKKASTLKKISLRNIFVDEFLKNLGLCQNIESFIACRAELDLKYISELSHLKELVLKEIKKNNSKA